jgi:hypothetical protein
MTTTILLVTALAAAISTVPGSVSDAVAPAAIGGLAAAPDGDVDRTLVALRVVRDLDRDGVQDLVLRTWGAGRAELATIAAAQGTVLWRVTAPDAAQHASAEPAHGSIAPLADIDRKGVGEVACLWREVGVAGETRGSTLAIHSGRDGSLLRSVRFPREPGRAWAGIVTATGDLDGDALPDLLVLTPARELWPGRLAAVGAASGDLLWTAPTACSGTGRDAAIAPLRDVDGDGVVDAALVGAGAVEIVSGRDGRLEKRVDLAPPEPAVETAVPRIAGLLPLEHAHGGTWIASGAILAAGDRDRDGAMDVLLPLREERGHASALALVSLGSGAELARTPLDVWGPELAETTVRLAGPIDADGVSDLLVADPGLNLPAAELTGGVDAGGARFVSGADGSTLRLWRGGRWLARVGAFAAVAGDVDRDGALDVWFSACDVAERPRDLVGLGSGATGEVLLWIELVPRRPAQASRPAVAAAAPGGQSAHGRAA